MAPWPSLRPVRQTSVAGCRLKDGGEDETAGGIVTTRITLDTFEHDRRSIRDAERQPDETVHTGPDRAVKQIGVAPSPPSK